MKKIWWLGLLLLIVSLPLSVRAASDLNNYYDKVSGSCQYDTGCWPFLTENNVVNGLRITIMDDDGTLLYGPTDYVNSVKHQAILNDGVNYFYSTNKGSKIDYIFGNKTAGFSSKTQSEQYQVNYLAFPNFIASDTGQNTIRSYFINNNTMSEALSQVLKQNGYLNSDGSLKENYTKEQIEKQFIVIEPLTYIIYDNQGYFGTAYELANAFFTSETGFKASNLHNTVRRVIPKALVVEGNIPQKLVNNQYFNGKLNIVTNVIQSPNKLNKSEIAGNGGYGIGLIWVPDIIKIKDGYDCPFNLKELETAKSQCEVGNYTTITLKDDKNSKNFTFSKNNCNTTYYAAKEYLKNIFPTDGRCQGGGVEIDPKTCSSNLNLLDSAEKSCRNGSYLSVSLGNDTTSKTFQFSKGNCSTVYNQARSFLETTFPGDSACKVNFSCSSNFENANCSNNQTGNYEDSDDWNNCLYNNSAYAWGISNPVCSVYCRESYNTLFPNNFKVVTAGYHFVWEPIYSNGKMECRTTKIDVDGWYQKWQQYNNEVPNLYNDWKFIEKKQAAIDALEKAGTTNTVCSRTPAVLCENGKPGCGNEPDGWLYGTTRVTYNGKTETVGGWCSKNSKPNLGVKDYQTKYEAALTRKDAWENSLKQCNDWDMTSNYLNSKDLNIKLTYQFLKGKETFTLVGDPSVTGSKGYCNKQVDGSCQNINDNSITLKSYRCTKDGCYLQDDNYYGYVMYRNQYVVQNLEKSVNYRLDQNVYRYVLKPSGESVHGPIMGYENYYDIGYGNLPVYFMTPNSQYDISLLYNNIGYQGHFDKVQETKDLEYSCKYEVKNCILGGDCPDTEDPGDKLSGLKVTYRPIDLKSPFPGENGIGRKEGVNWTYQALNYDYTVDSLKVLNDLKEIYITNNRNVNTDAVYDLEPMYEFFLTPSNIRKIREYNRVQNKTGEGYADFKMTCNGDGVECRSLFLNTETNKGLYFDKPTGVCLSYTGGSNWNTCRYQ